MFSFNLAMYMNPFMSISIALIVGILFGQLVNKFKIPAVAGYIIAGLIIGISGFKIIDDNMIETVSFISDFALGIVAFNIGSELKFSKVKKLGKSIFTIALFEAFGAFLLVSLSTYFLIRDVGIAIILGAVSSATAPAATVMVLKEYKSKGDLTSTLLGVVAVDDGICLIIYALASSIAKVVILNENITAYKVVFHPVIEIVFSIISGALLGVMLSFFMSKAKKNSEILSFCIGFIILCVGVALKFKLSPLLSAMSLGILVANVSNKSRIVFDGLEKFSPPVIGVFFVMAGSRLDISLLPKIGTIGVFYLVFRIIGKVFGASFGAKLSKSPENVKKYIGYGLLSQVGVAVGLAIVVSKEFAGTNLGSMVITILLATTIITEIIGPIATKTVILKSGEAKN